MNNNQENKKRDSIDEKNNKSGIMIDNIGGKQNQQKRNVCIHKRDID